MCDVSQHGQTGVQAGGARDLTEKNTRMRGMIRRRDETRTQVRLRASWMLFSVRVGPGVAPFHNTAKYWGYTSQWNLLDYPTVVLPVTKSDKNTDKTDKF